MCCLKCIVSFYFLCCIYCSDGHSSYTQWDVMELQQSCVCHTSKRKHALVLKQNCKRKLPKRLLVVPFRGAAMVFRPPEHHWLPWYHFFLGGGRFGLGIVSPLVKKRVLGPPLPRRAPGTVRSNQITFIVTSSHHMYLGEWNSWEWFLITFLWYVFKNLSVYVSLVAKYYIKYRCERKSSISCSPTKYNCLFSYSYLQGDMLKI